MTVPRVFLSQVPYLRTSRDFPSEIETLTIELSKSYIDIANAVNARIIGMFPTNKPSITGETWLFDRNKKQQGLRQVFTFSTLANIPHNINFEDVSRFTRCYGEYTDGINWYGLISGSSTSIIGQISFYLTPTDIIFLSGAGAIPVTADFMGILVLEWLSNV